MTKKQKKTKDKEKRVVWGMNLGTITHKSKKDYNRKENKIREVEI